MTICSGILVFARVKGSVDLLIFFLLLTHVKSRLLRLGACAFLQLVRRVLFQVFPEVWFLVRMLCGLDIMSERVRSRQVLAIVSPSCDLLCS